MTAAPLPATLLAAARRAAGGPPPRRRLWRRFVRHRLAVAGAVVLALLGAAVLAAPLLGRALGIDGTVDLLGRMAPPSAAHPLGTDELGRDLLLRLLQGGRVSLAVGLVAAFAAAVIGTAIGLVAGYRGGWLDRALMRVTDGVIALPLLPLLIVLAALDLQKLGLPDAIAHSPAASFWRMAILITLFGWTTVARLVRGATLAAREREYVRAALALGCGGRRIMLVHILPNIVSPIVVATTLAVGNVILVESVLSFLGLGIQPPLPSWGNMLTGAQELIWTAPALAVWPGLLIFVTVIACNLVGDGLQDALDPRALSDRPHPG
jgi:peptide/nickel transport system permease protein